MKARRERKALVAAHFRTGRASEFVFESERLVSRRTETGKANAVFGPGFFDLQCNGYAGVDFNHPTTTPEQVVEAIRAMWRHGCTEVLPTIITAQPERLEHLLRTLVAALRLDPDVRRAVPGFHLEGPFISPEDGARGAHPLHAVRPVSVALWRRLQRAAEGMIRLVTVAPEVRGAADFIRRLRGEGVVPAIGHTLATSAQIRAAADAGALLSTHLGNGCPEMLHRHRNPVFAQLGEDRLAASLITDGVHLPPEVVRTFFRAKGAQRTVLVTDAMAAAGAPPGRYTIGDLALEVGEDRIARQPGKPNFAGSAATMDRAVVGFARMTGAGLAQAWDAASARAWAVLRAAIPGVKAPRSWIIGRTERDAFAVVAAGRGRSVLWRR
jgi:N-acetylglucosamine-6-phosphate deacetylase